MRQDDCGHEDELKVEKETLPRARNFYDSVSMLWKGGFLEAEEDGATGLRGRDAG